MCTKTNTCVDPRINGIPNGFSDFNAMYPSVSRALTLIEYSVSVDIDAALVSLFA